MKKKHFLFISIFALSVFSMSCDKDTDASPSSSRAIKYEITGNYTGTITLVGVTNNDNFEIMEINKLPWKLEFEAKKEITYVLIQGVGDSGITGQTATLKTFIGGKEVSTGTGTALSSGYISVTNKQYFLK